MCHDTESRRKTTATTSKHTSTNHDISRPHRLQEGIASLRRRRFPPSTSYRRSYGREWIQPLMIYAWLAFGGAFGTMSRYAVSGWVIHRFGPSALGTFTVNIAGSFLVGLVLVLTEGRFVVAPDVRTFLTTGFLGGFTTFSTLMFETMGLVENGSLQRAVLNAGGSLVAGLIAVWFGMTVARLL